MVHFIKVVLLFGMGLTGLYMMHLLAQDYDRIRQPLEAATRFLTSASSRLRAKRSTTHHQQQQQLYQLHYEQQQKLLNDTLASINWKRILSHDPFHCLQSLICQLMSGAMEDAGNSRDVTNMVDFIELSMQFAPANLHRAFKRGLAAHGNSKICYEEFYPFCIYSARTMLRAMTWFANGSNE